MSWQAGADSNGSQNKNKGKYEDPKSVEDWLRKIDSAIKFGVEGFENKNSKYPAKGLTQTNKLLNDLGAMISGYIEEQQKFNAAMLEYIRGMAHGMAQGMAHG